MPHIDNWDEFAQKANDMYTKDPKFRYTRPEFLQLKTDDEIIVSADHQVRPIILPRDASRLPWKSGYAECINAGKSLRNEDQAAFHQGVILPPSSIATSTLNSTENEEQERSIRKQLPWFYFGLFDGHAGTAVAVAAAAQLHQIIGEKLERVADLLVALEFDFDLDEDSDEYTHCTTCRKASPSVLPGATDDSSGVVDVAGTINADTTNDGANVADSDGTAAATNVVELISVAETATTKLSTDDDKILSSNQSRTSASDATESSKLAGNLDNHVRKCRDVCLYSERSLPSTIDICRNNVTVESLITGALESAFWDMDALIAHDKQVYLMPGGCTALVSLFILGKLYVCNAGDSRAIVYKNDKVIPMSFDFTPTSERGRILRLGQQRPEFLGSDFTHLEFKKRPTRKDLGKQMLYRDAYMTGWSMKTITYDDLRFPLVWGEGKRSRVLATIGVTRGFGDHELTAQYGSVLIKPFLTPEPEVKVLSLESDDSLTAEDVLIMGSDGLWDVTSNEQAAQVVKNSFYFFPDSHELPIAKYRYITAAQDLVIQSRGTIWNNVVWRIDDSRSASLDDIAVFVIPLKQYKDDYLEWKKLRFQAKSRTCKHTKTSDFRRVLDLIE